MKLLHSFIGVLLLTGCSHTPSLRPGPDLKSDRTSVNKSKPTTPSDPNEAVKELLIPAWVSAIDVESIIKNLASATPRKQPVQEWFKKNKPLIVKIEDKTLTKILLEEEKLLGFSYAKSRRYPGFKQKVRTCRQVPIENVWKEFGPLFDYEWSDSFKNFASLFMAIWERESLYSSTKRGVLVSSNCTARLPRYISALPGKTTKIDLILASKKDAYLEEYYEGCNLSKADYGPLQWNYFWRLKSKQYEKIMRKALALTTEYSKEELARANLLEVSQLIKFNPKALYFLAALYLQKGSENARQTIARYNPDPSYRKTVFERRSQMFNVLAKKQKCISKDELLAESIRRKNRN